MRSLALFLLLGCSRQAPLPAAPGGPTSAKPLPSSELAPPVSSAPKRTPTGETEVTIFEDGAGRAMSSKDLSTCRTEPMIGWVIYSIKVGPNGKAGSSSIVERVGVTQAAADCVPPKLQFDPPAMGVATYTVYVAFR